ncbi:MAG TPA: hypothetical protein VFR81_00680, partial [Longimicrobium sp.]|nr:hypothetical protein [Longimicrobium sp.]
PIARNPGGTVANPAPQARQQQGPQGGGQPAWSAYCPPVGLTVNPRQCRSAVDACPTRVCR